MASAALFSVAQVVLKQLGSKFLEEAALLWGIGDDVQKLTRTLSSIQAVLLDAEEQSQSPQSHQLRLWLKELGQVVYDAEDLLDDFSTEVLRRQGMMATSGTELRISKEVRNFFSSSNQVAYGLKIAHGIQAVRVRLDEIAERREMFHLEVRAAESTSRKHRETDSHVPQVIVGREADKTRVLNLLLQPSKDKVSVVPIVGIGGLGKTTLAQLVFNDESVKSHFELKVWVCISENFDVKLIVEQIIESWVGKKLDNNLQMDMLRELLHKNVNGKKYFMVFDDVWNEDREKWNRLKSLLKGGAEGGRIVITTRLTKVAKLATRMEPYELEGLDEGEAWSLFREIAFEGGEAGSMVQESIGREIVGKCKGVPLAIKTIAGALFFRETDPEWVAFKGKNIWKMEDQSENDIMPTLKLSYDHLPTHLKHCFAYCKLFPKDYEIDVKNLIQLWVAQGYVKKSSLSDSLDRFDVGLEYFKDLLWRSFFEEAVKDPLGNIASCKMHDLMHDLAIEVAGEEIVTFDICNAQKHKQSCNADLHAIQHFSLEFKQFSSSNTELPKSHWTSMINNAEKLRTVLAINKQWLPYHEEFTFCSTTSCRALNLSYFQMLSVSNTIHNLKHLRYLDLSGNDMETLPEEITQLVNLEVLKLEGCPHLRQLPRNTRNLLSLVHLAINNCIRLECMPLGIGQLSGLRELSIFPISEGGNADYRAAAEISELGNLNSIRGSLKIRNLEYVENSSEGVAANLRDKQHLEQLKLSWRASDEGNSDVVNEGQLLEALCPHPNLKVLRLSNNGGLKCPSWLPSLKNLVMIKIVNSAHWRCLLSLCQLPFLKQLELINLFSLEWIETHRSPASLSLSSSSSASSFFPSLKFLRIKDCPNLKGWRSIPASEAEVVLPGFGCVSHLQISNCPKIISIPHFSPWHLEGVDLCGGNKELLKQILRKPPVSVPHSSSRLEKLEISYIDDLDSLPEEIFPHLSSLKKLCIGECRNLSTLYPTLPFHLTSLVEIFIYSCPELEDLSHIEIVRREEEEEENITMQYHGGGILLPSLKVMHLLYIPKLVSLPKWLQLVPSLEDIRIRSCSITCIPKWIVHLRQLESLEISDCKISAGEFTDEDLTKVAHVEFVLIDGLDMKGDIVFDLDTEEFALGQLEDDSEFLVAEQEEREKEVEGDEIEEETSGLIQFLTHARWLVTAPCTAFLRCFGSSSSRS